MAVLGNPNMGGLDQVMQQLYASGQADQRLALEEERLREQQRQNAIANQINKQKMQRQGVLDFMSAAGNQQLPLDYRQGALQQASVLQDPQNEMLDQQALTTGVPLRPVSQREFDFPKTTGQTQIDIANLRNQREVSKQGKTEAKTQDKTVKDISKSTDGLFMKIANAQALEKDRTKGGMGSQATVINEAKNQIKNNIVKLWRLKKTQDAEDAGMRLQAIDSSFDYKRERLAYLRSLR